MAPGNPDTLCANATCFAHCIAMSPAPLHRLPTPPDRLAEALATIAPQLAASAAEHDLQGNFPHDNFALLHASGLIAQVIPQTHGGGGAGLQTARQIIASIAHADAATALVLTMTYLQHRAIARADTRWPAHVRQQVFATALNEGALINALRVEPDLGTPARGGLPATVATRVGNRWRIRGRKLYSTGSPALRWLSVWGRTDEAEPRVGIFLVPRPLPETPGIRIEETWNHLGLRASGSHDVILEDVEIPLDHAVDIRPASEWAAHSAAQADTGAQLDQQAWMNVLLGSLYDAVAQAARDWLIQFLNTRAPANLGGPLATLPRMQEVVGEVAAALQTNRVLLDHAAEAADAGAPLSITDSGLLKYTVTANAIRAVELALQLSGNHGLSRRNPLERHYRDVLCSRIHTPQNDSILLAAGRTALGV
ncbi:alkylation response protein AidB-like acyl-CoA dehydrogenase [Ralstonia sp. GP73]|uniref:Acyl-CoA dehydrogenase YdbM n=3 Tax=Ralstonia TaxID=48736 RepID=A0AAD2BTL7_9RALS|nr:alkylation response protein AidB-like acyl-CoA dehydrogenase [Ralstonia sp. GP73]CAJ0716702.1 Putative acyl-CoA dehydrogenase YdbM [Ralstonia sp. LMG 18095]CAJ0798822.1 Putative acyl-CoA dehydrogenase YdbM [Ralstonia sp. LMG 18095]CAJ0806297.1 Putative acyl-CoA dehydrogenase YdbM [Ralstonia sp. LMG 18095]CAJ0893710.1 Putative acyl-CoA dehydrogenase YdbM [Ralstonia sp. LMG 18095]